MPSPPTRNRGWPGSRICNPSPPGTKPNAPGGAAERGIDPSPASGQDAPLHDPGGPLMLNRMAVCALALALSIAAQADATQKTRCERILDRFGDRLVNATCVESPDLTTTNPGTTPLDNSIAGLPTGAFTPRTDRTVIAPDPANKTPITKVLPGIQLNGYIAGDPTGQARFLLRL